MLTKRQSEKFHYCCSVVRKMPESNYSTLDPPIWERLMKNRLNWEQGSIYIIWKWIFSRLWQFSVDILPWHRKLCSDQVHILPIIWGHKKPSKPIIRSLEVGYGMWNSTKWKWISFCQRKGRLCNNTTTTVHNDLYFHYSNCKVTTQSLTLLSSFFTLCIHKDWMNHHFYYGLLKKKWEGTV